MANTSKIEWCDSTFNPWIGCTKVSPACDNCYAAVATPSRTLGVEWGAGKPRHRTSDANWKLPLRWNAQMFYACSACGWRGQATECKSVPHPDDQMPCAGCPRCGSTGLAKARRRVFCSSLADVFDNEVPGSWRSDLFNMIRATPNLDWLLLTKRIGNAARMMDEAGAWSGADDRGARNPLPNVWIGATICNQAEADRDVPKLLSVPAAVRFLSIEPALGPVDLTAIKQTVSPGYFGDCLQWYHQPHCDRDTPYPTINWVIGGGESGSHARPIHPDWARSLRDQCAAAGVPFLFKQWGEWVPVETDGDIEGHYDDGSDRPLYGRVHVSVAHGLHHLMGRVGKKAAGRLLEGKTHEQYPRGAT